MKIGLLMSSEDPFAVTLRHLPDFEAAGLDRVLVPEAYTFDSVSRPRYVQSARSRTESSSV